MTDVKFGAIVKITRASASCTEDYVGQIGMVVDVDEWRDEEMVRVMHKDRLLLWHDIDAVENIALRSRELMVLQILRNAPKDLTAEGEKNLAQEIVRAWRAYGESSDTSDAGVNRGINAGSDGA